MGSKQIVLNPHCKDNQVIIDKKIEKIKEIEEILKNELKTKYESLLLLDEQIRASASKSQIQKVIFEYIKLLVKLRKQRINL